MPGSAHIVAAGGLTMFAIEIAVWRHCSGMAVRLWVRDIFVRSRGGGSIPPIGYKHKIWFMSGSYSVNI